MADTLRFVSAGAGSGKTYRLTQILHEKLSSGQARPAGVIATTFTRKAATELRERRPHGAPREGRIRAGEFDRAGAHRHGEQRLRRVSRALRVRGGTGHRTARVGGDAV